MAVIMFFNYAYFFGVAYFKGTPATPQCGALGTGDVDNISRQRKCVFPELSRVAKRKARKSTYDMRREGMRDGSSCMSHRESDTR